MENEKIKIGIKEIRELSMTEDEKQSIFHNIINAPLYNKDERVKSSWGSHYIISFIKRNQLAYYIVIPLIVVLSGGGVVFASQESLPNHILYPIKVKIIEPVEGALTFSQAEKAKLQSKLATTRLVEAQALAKEKKLDEVTKEKINKLLVSHTLALDTAINKANNNVSKKEVDEITTNFRAEMNANARILEIINENEEVKEDESKIKEVNQEIKEQNNIETIEKETQMIDDKQEKETTEMKKEIKEKENTEIIEEKIIEDDFIINIEKKEKEDTKFNSLSKTARESAISIKNSLNENKTDNKDNYKDKKENLRLLLENINKNINENRVKGLIIDKKIMYDTEKKIEEAKKYLEEAEKKEIEKNEKESYLLLLDAESLLKEVEILIKSKSNLENNKKTEVKIETSIQTKI